mmetsp:Transcript_16540/g.18863  ORF Transcript_16540/g.18863 Transcript_16540/m.18863 type:complete len:270 (+) Transcript_16540:110-919(+)
MVGVSYHELQAGVPSSARHTAGQRKQFLVICVIGAAFAANAFITAGLFEPVFVRNDGIYPGGEFVYKLIEDRDYATTGGIWRKISEDLKSDPLGVDENFDDSLYSVYIDNLDSGFGRYFSGILIDHSKDAMKNKLLATKRDLEIVEDDPLGFRTSNYKIGDLPSVRAHVATFPYTDGFVSALLHNYKVFPALLKHAKNFSGNGRKIVISSTCDRELKRCNHYVPMIEEETFLLGEPDTDEYAKSKEGKDVDGFDFVKILKGVKKLFGLK